MVVLLALVCILGYLWYRHRKLSNHVKFQKVDADGDSASEILREDIEGTWRCKSETYHITRVGEGQYRVEGKGETFGDSFLGTATINKDGQFSLYGTKYTALPQGTIFGRRRLVWSTGDTWYKCKPGDTLKYGESSEGDS